MLIILGMISLTSQFSCKKALEEQINSPSNSKSKLTRAASNKVSVNPYSVDNIQKSLAELHRNETLDQNRIYYYYKFNPEKVTGDILKELENDNSLKILDYPFGDGNLYSKDNSELTLEDLESRKDGNLYIVYKSTSNIDYIFKNGADIDALKLDELYLPQPNDQDLQLQALISSGYTSEPDISSLKFKLPCLLKQPCGKVTYLDQEDGNTKPVPEIEVWALVFGIPVTTNTNQNGDYCIPYHFSVGTLMGTHAKNSKVRVKPLNTTGTIVGAALSIISNFIIGSNHTEGWFGSCAMKNSINIHFGSHTQARYWAKYFMECKSIMITLLKIIFIMPQRL